ncbi:Hypothetical protein FKW44_000667 [Caligus rogercresseyi]|uniref:Uncharacterized protein n=1 Tax=Caligus rogercresseyi TaxID=217165 RepID=A0A7T8KHT1_CALRO|nr:Hypothetical protein FKW44_000667 [Caligus rogercresseyi]
MKKMNAVKEAISNTIGRFFTTNKPKSNGVISEEDGGNKTLNGVPSSNGSLKPSDEEPRLGAQEEEDDGLKKRKKSFSSSNGELEGSPLKKVPSESRWNSNGGVVDELMRQSSLAEKVTSWNGGKSITFSSSSSSYNSRREDADDRDGYDDELDRGRKRK